MIRVAHARNVRMESLECFLGSRERWTRVREIIAEALTFVWFELILIVWVTFCRSEFDGASLMAVDTYLLINDNIDFHTLLGLALKNPVKAPLWMIRRWTT